MTLAITPHLGKIRLVYASDSVYSGASDSDAVIGSL